MLRPSSIAFPPSIDVRMHGERKSPLRVEMTTQSSLLADLRADLTAVAKRG